MIKKLILFLMLFIPIISYSNQKVRTDGKDISYLYIQYASTAVLTPTNWATGQYTLALKDFPPYVIYFSDRPNRVSGILCMRKFLKIWEQGKNDNFGKNPPNVSITGIRLHLLDKEKDEFFTVELSHPQYDEKKQLLLYDATVLTADRKNMPQRESILRHVILFVDGWCPSCCCG